MLRVFLLLMVCGLMSVQGIRQPGQSFMSRSADHSVNATEAKFAECIPTDQVLHIRNLMNETDPNVMYSPRSTRVKRCSGCCPNSYHTCQPSKKKKRIFSVWVTKYDGNIGKEISKSQKIMTVRDHESCKCACRVKKCGENQEFDNELCRCVNLCKNSDEQKNCRGDKNKIWNPANCRCECISYESCNETYRNPNFETCRCE